MPYMLTTHQFLRYSLLMQQLEVIIYNVILVLSNSQYTVYMYRMLISKAKYPVYRERRFSTYYTF